MKYTHGEGVLVVALLAALSGCADPASETVGPRVSPESQVGTTPSSPSSSDERDALTKIARLVAVAMDNEPARQRLKRDMQAAPFREHKLELASYLRSFDGNALLRRMVTLNGDSETDLFTTIAAIRPLELYMPVAGHRESWTGSAGVLVVSQLDESEPIVAFNERGKPVTLDRAVPPDQPTLSLVPVETDFSQPIPPIASRNVRDRNGAAIGTLEAATIRSASASMITCIDFCDEEATSGGGVAAIEPGLYLEFSRIVDVKEPWFRGDPEIEVHIQGPNSSFAPTYGEDLSCSGEHAYDYRKVFNQDGGFWEGRVMLFSGDETVAFVNKFNQGFHILFWEDDNTPCTLKLDSNALVQLLNSMATAFSTVAIKLIPGAPWKLVAGAFVAALFSNPGQWLLTNDDFVGVAVEQASVGYSYPANTHVIMDGTTLNGRATIVYRQ
jgi:hypothetical protein